jgi:hypothetical protein
MFGAFSVASYVVYGKIRIGFVFLAWTVAFVYGQVRGQHSR